MGNILVTHCLHLFIFKYLSCTLELFTSVFISKDLEGLIPDIVLRSTFEIFILEYYILTCSYFPLNPLLREPTEQE
jgi:hypothetical protein